MISISFIAAPHYTATNVTLGGMFVQIAQCPKFTHYCMERAATAEQHVI